MYDFFALPYLHFPCGSEVPPYFGTLEVTPTRGGCCTASSLVIERVHTVRWNFWVDCPMASTCGGAQRFAGWQAGEISHNSPHKRNQGWWILSRWKCLAFNTPNNKFTAWFISVSSHITIMNNHDLLLPIDPWSRFPWPNLPHEIRWQDQRAHSLLVLSVTTGQRTVQCICNYWPQDPPSWTGEGA